MDPFYQIILYYKTI